MQNAAQEQGAPEVVRGPGSSPKCSECPFAKNGQPGRAVPGEGPRDPLFIVLGEGPGDMERETRRPFVGASGRMLKGELGASGVLREQVWITNAMLCTPPGASDDAKHLARLACAPRLREELAQFPRKPILALGAHAAQGLLGDAFSITELAGSYHEVDVDGTGPRGIIPTLHPAHILRGGAEGSAHSVDLLIWNLRFDVAKVAALGRGRAVHFSEDVEWEASDPVRAEALVLGILRDIEELGWGAYDTETTSKRPLEAELRTIAFATPKRAVAVAWEILTPRAHEAIRSFLRDPHIHKVLQNLIYDHSVLEAKGYELRGPVDDTLLAHHCAFPGLAHDLQRMTTQFFVVRPWKAEHDPDEALVRDPLVVGAYCLLGFLYAMGANVAEQARLVELHALLKYNALDALATARLRPILKNLVKHTKTEAAYGANLANALIAVKMYLAGVPIDLEENKRLEKEFSDRLEEVKRRLDIREFPDELREKFFDRLAMEQAKTVRKKDPPDYVSRWAVRLAELKKQYEKGKFVFKPNSGAHVAAIARARGIVLTEETPKGKTSTKGWILEGLRRVPEIDASLEGREAGKMLSTFVVKVRESVDVNGRIHPRPNVHRITNRWAFEDPMIQNWSKGHRRRRRPNMRRQVVAPEGRKLLGFDYDKQEARGVTILSGEPLLVDIFQEKKDIHMEFARMVWPDIDSLEPDARKELRDFVKRPEYGAFYKGTIDALWRNILKDDPDVKREDVAQVVLAIQSKLHTLNAWHDELLGQVALPPHELRSIIFGWRRVFPLGNASPTDVANWPVQTLGAELMAIGSLLIAPHLGIEIPHREETLRRVADKVPTLRKLIDKDAWPWRVGEPIRNVAIITQVHDAWYFEHDDEPKVATDLTELIHASFAHTVTYRGREMPFPVEVHEGRSWADV